MGPTIKDVMGAALLAVVLIGLVIVLFVSTLQAAG